MSVPAEKLDRLHLYLDPSLTWAITKAVSDGHGRDKSDYIRSAVKADLNLIDKFGEDYGVVTSLLERLDADVIVKALIDARKG
jgi:hypothetical protein